jgi:hypothetical protein
MTPHGNLALETLRAELEAAGWRIWPNSNASQSNDCKWYACTKLADDVPDCQTNGKPPSLLIQPYSHVLNGRPFEQSEFSVTGETGGVWLSLKAYSINTKDAVASIPKARALLLAAWTAATKVGA